MKAVRLHEFGDPQVLRLEDIATPEPGAGEVRIRVAATTFNPVDATIRSGSMAAQLPVALPHTPGIEVAGTVDAVGAEVEGLAVGDPVVAFLPMVAAGAAAEFVLAPADVLVAAPTTIPLADAAALPMAALTAWQSLFDHGGLTAGQRVLITGAGGAVGRYAVQLAAAAGAHVVAVAGPRHRDALLAAGAAELVDPTATPLAEPVDLALNLAPVEPEQLTALADLVRPGGAVVNTTVWMPAPTDEARGVRGVDVFVRSDTAQLAELVARVDRGELQVDVAERVPLDRLLDVHARAAAGQLTGRVVVLVGT